MITIGKPFITYENDRAFLRARVEVPDEVAAAYVKATEPNRQFCVWLTDEDYPPKAWTDKDHTLWFDAPVEYGRYLCSERSNAFITGLFWYACAAGSDIQFEAPMSERLYRGFTEQLIPSLEKNGFKAIRLIGPVTSEPVECAGGIVAGMTAGVDSNYTLKCYEGDDAPGGLKLTHLAYYTCCSLFKPRDVYKGLDALYKDEQGIIDIVLSRAREVAAGHNIPLVDVNTNLDRDYYRGGVPYMGMYRYLACTLSLEHLYSIYISSSTGHGSSICQPSLLIPTQHYEELLCGTLRTETLRYVSSDNETRTEKLKAIADDKYFQKTASVCFDTGAKGENCGECYGCWKTMIPLDLLGKLDDFKDSFDVDKYYRNREETFRELLEFARRPEATSARETVEQIRALAEAERSEAGDLFLECMAKQNYD